VSKATGGCPENKITLNYPFFHVLACTETESAESLANQQLNYIVLVIFVISLYGVGVGQTAVSTLGIPYIDDNVASKESPIYLAITIGVKILGPAFGFILGSYCIRLYVKLTDVPQNDPRWVGAWWLGFVLISGSMALTSMAMLMFPKHLKGKKLSHDDNVPKTAEEKMLLESPPRLQGK
jgi:dipeptide/tripeptide permease